MSLLFNPGFNGGFQDPQKIHQMGGGSTVLEIHDNVCMYNNMIIQDLFLAISCFWNAF